MHLRLARLLRASSLLSFVLVGCSANPGDGPSAATSAAVTANAELSWVGATQVAYAVPARGASAAPVAVDPSFVVGGQDLTVETQVYPEGSAQTVTVFWANADYSSISSADMTFASSGAGAYGDNDSYSGIIPAAALPGGSTAHYWVRAVAPDGTTLYDSQNGANYTLTPRALSVAWAGNLGAYDAQGGAAGFYRTGNLLNVDQSTATGCFWEGADDYQVQAVQVYVPGLTDQGYSGDLAAVAGALLTAQVWTDLRKDGWGAVPMACQPDVGNNYVCPLTLATFPESGTCLVDGPVDPGDYEYKLRFSADGGQSWYWVGTSSGDGGGSNLVVQYDPGCLYSADDPFTCEALSGFDEGVVRLTTAVGATTSSTTTYTNPGASTTLTNVRLVGADTSKMTVAVTQNGAPITGGTVTLAAGDALNVTVTYTPTASTSGTVPDMADVAWDVSGATTYALHLRGTTD